MSQPPTRRPSHPTDGPDEFDRRNRLAWLKGSLVDVSPLGYRQFRLLLTGRLVAVVGLGMLAVVLSVQTFELTGSSLQVALINTALGVSAVAGSLTGGVLADRFDRRRLILAARALALAGFVALALNAGAEQPSVALLYAFAVWDGAFGALGAEAMGAAVPAVVPPALLAATGALMALCLDLASVAAPLLAGVLAAAAGPVTVYWTVVVLSAVSWVVLFRLAPVVPERAQTNLAIPASPVAPLTRAAQNSPDSRHRQDRHGSHTGQVTSPGGARALLRSWAAVVRVGWADLGEGWAFVRSDRVVSAVLLIGFLQIFFASPYVLIPEFVGQDLGGGPEAVGLIYAAPAAGALLAGLVSGWIGRVRRTGVLLVCAFVVSSLGVTAFGLAPALWVAVAAMVLVGVTDVVGEVLRFTLLAGRTPDHVRGRVLSLWSAQATVGDAVGGPVLALGAKAIGAGPVIAVGGLLAAVSTAVLLLTRPQLRERVSGSGDDSSGPRGGEPKATASTGPIAPPGAAVRDERGGACAAAPPGTSSGTSSGAPRAGLRAKPTAGASDAPCSTSPDSLDRPEPAAQEAP